MYLNFIRRVAFVFLAAHLLPMIAMATPLYPEVNITTLQTAGPTVSPLGGQSLWTSTFKFTNAEPAALTNVQYVNTVAWAHIAGTPYNPNLTPLQNDTAMTWNDALGRFELGNVSATPYNNFGSIQLMPAITDLPVTPGFGVTPSSHVPTFTVGPLAINQSVSGIQLNWTLSNTIDGFIFSGGFVAQAAPEPSTLALLSLGAIGLLARRRFPR